MSFAGALGHCVAWGEWGERRRGEERGQSRALSSTPLLLLCFARPAHSKTHTRTRVPLNRSTLVYRLAEREAWGVWWWWWWRRPRCAHALPPWGERGGGKMERGLEKERQGKNAAPRASP